MIAAQFTAFDTVRSMALAVAHVAERGNLTKCLAVSCCNSVARAAQGKYWRSNFEIGSWAASLACS